MLKIKNTLFLCLTALALNSLAQNIAPAAVKDHEGIIEYKLTISKEEYKTIFTDTLLIRNSFVLEPLKVDSTIYETNQSKGTTKLISSNRKLQWYYLMDVSKMTGMGFNTEKRPASENIKVFKSESKLLGYMLTSEPFLVKYGFKINDYSKGKDTVYNGKKCFFITANGNISVQNNSAEDKLLSTRMVIDPGIKGQNYPFISEVIALHFGGAIVFVESHFQSGLNVSMQYRYKTELTSVYRAIFDKYQSLYFSNIKLLDQLKTNY